jgi:hypothetical protein
MGADMQCEEFQFPLVSSSLLAFTIKMYYTQPGDAAFPFRNHDICEIQLDSFDKIKVAVFFWRIRDENRSGGSGRRHGMTIPNEQVPVRKACCPTELRYGKAGGKMRSTSSSYRS